MEPDRAVFTVKRDGGLWAVEHEGEFFGHAQDQEVARAAATRRMREVQNSGRACQIRVHGERGFHGQD